MFLLNFLFSFLVKKKIKKVITKAKMLTLTEYIQIGKALRSSLMYQVACNNKVIFTSCKEVIDCAVLLELLHNISIIHDDVIDGEKIRRNQKTLNETIGLYKSINVGNFFLLSSFENFFKKNRNENISSELIEKLRLLCQGEILQDEQFSKINQIPQKKKLIDVVRQKTGALFALSCKIPYLLNKDSDSDIKFAEECGFFYGIVYQILDDIVDIKSDLSFLNNKNLFFRHWTLPILILKNDYNNYFLKVINENQNVPKFINEKIIQKCFLELNKVFDSIKKKSLNKKNKHLLFLIVDSLNKIIVKKKMSSYCFEI